MAADRGRREFSVCDERRAQPLVVVSFASAGLPRGIELPDPALMAELFYWLDDAHIDYEIRRFRRRATFPALNDWPYPGQHRADGVLDDRRLFQGQPNRLLARLGLGKTHAFLEHGYIAVQGAFS